MTKGPRQRPPDGAPHDTVPLALATDVMAIQLSQRRRFVTLSEVRGELELLGRIVDRTPAVDGLNNPRAFYVARRAGVCSTAWTAETTASSCGGVSSG